MNHDLDLTAKTDGDLYALIRQHRGCAVVASQAKTKLYHYAMCVALCAEYQARRGLLKWLS